MVKALIKQFEEWNDFIIKIKEMNWETPLGDGKWRVHDVVSHIMFWDKYFFEEAIDRITHDQELTLKHLDFDQFNQRAIEQGKYLTKDELIGLTLKYRNEILENIKSMNDDDISTEYIDADGNKFNVEMYLRDFIWHDRHHMSQIEEVVNNLV